MTTNNKLADLSRHTLLFRPPLFFPPLPDKQDKQLRMKDATTTTTKKHVGVYLSALCEVPSRMNLRQSTCMSKSDTCSRDGASRDNRGCNTNIRPPYLYTKTATKLHEHIRFESPTCQAPSTKRAPPTPRKRKQRRWWSHSLNKWPHGADEL